MFSGYGATHLIARQNRPSYIKSPDLKNWSNAFGEPNRLPATLDEKSIIVDPIPVKGGIVNLAAKLCLDKNLKPLFVYHKYDDKG